MLPTGEKYINPLTDFGFKKLFGSEPNKDLLIDFLNQILPGPKVKDLTYSDKERPGRSQVDRSAIFDIFCTGPNGEHFIVEMQKAKQNYFKDRSLFYASYPIIEQGNDRDWNFKLNPVYAVGILDFTFKDGRKKEDGEVLHVVDLKDQNCEVFYDKLRFVYIELPHFKKSIDELATRLDKWLYVLRHLSRLNERPPALKERVFQKLFKAAKIASFSSEERDAYDYSLKVFRDLNNVVETAVDEGIKRGLKQGLEQGLEQGASAERKKIAQKMKQAGIPTEIIQQATGLSATVINQL